MPRAASVWSSDLDGTGRRRQVVVPFGFPKTARLLTPADFKFVFDAAAIKVSSREILILARASATDSPRLGLVIAKKHVRHATQRNRIKRIVRESFRHQQQNLGGWDVVVLARSGVAQFDNPALRSQIDQLWKQFCRRVAKHREVPTC